MLLLLATLLWEKYMWRVIKFQSNLFKLYLISWSEVLNKKEMNWGIILKGNEAIVVFITRKFLNFLSTHFPMVNKTFHRWIVVVLNFNVCFVIFLSCSLSSFHVINFFFFLINILAHIKSYQILFWTGSNHNGLCQKKKKIVKGRTYNRIHAAQCVPPSPMRVCRLK